MLPDDPPLDIEALRFEAIHSSGDGLGPVDLRVEPGERLLVIGPSGSGKSTLLQALSGVIPHAIPAQVSGSIRICGTDTRESGVPSLSRLLSVVAQNPSSSVCLPDVADEVAFPLENHAWPPSAMGGAVEAALELVGAASLINRRSATLSGGEKQRVILARALAQQPQLLILDEPTNHLDPRYQLELLQLVKRLQIGTLASIHDLNLAAAFCDRLYVLDHGRIVASGTPKEVLTAPLLRDVFGVEALIDEHPLHGYPRITWITQP